MKKRSQSTKRKKSNRKSPAEPKKTVAGSKAPLKKDTPVKQSPVRPVSKKSPDKKVEKKKEGKGSLTAFFRKGVQFLRESRNELKKVKWPTRKELLASTAVVLFLSLFVALYLGLVDFGLIKIIKNLVG